MSKHIVIFDSGLGGSTILKHIKAKLPDCQYSYVMDNDYFPYSSKSNSDLKTRILHILGQAIDELKPDLVVIACNTASTLVLDELRNRHDLPFVGVVPAIKPAAQQTKTNHICLLATKSTITRSYVDKLQQDFAPNSKLLRFGSCKLVEISEKKLQGLEVDKNEISSICKEIRQLPDSDKIDSFVLGCTHFPAIQQELQQCWLKSVNWLDSGEAIARRTEHLLANMDSQKASQPPKPPTLYASNSKKVSQIPDCLELLGFSTSKKMDLS